MKKAVFMTNLKERFTRVYPEHVVRVIAKDAELLCDTAIAADTLDQYADVLRQTQVIFSTWGMPELTEAQIKTYLPNLEAIFYAAGTVQKFARPFLKCGVTIMSAWAANAVPVAEYAHAQILLANKGFFSQRRLLPIRIFPSRAFRGTIASRWACWARG